MQVFAVSCKLAKRYSVELLLGVIGTWLYFSPHFSENLEFNRVLISHGEYWRLLTGQLVHFGPLHWWMDYAAILLAALLSPIGWHWRGAWQLLVSFLMVALVLWCFTDITHYRGISGVVYGWLMLAAVRCVWLGWVRKTLFVTLLTMKVFYDMSQQGSGALGANWLDAKIAYEAHFAGLLAAMLLLLFYHLHSLLRQRQ